MHRLINFPLMKTKLKLERSEWSMGKATIKAVKNIIIVETKKKEENDDKMI